jgi:hypothetical protein
MAEGVKVLSFLLICSNKSIASATRNDFSAGARAAVAVDEARHDFVCDLFDATKISVAHGIAMVEDEKDGGEHLAAFDLSDLSADERVRLVRWLGWCRVPDKPVRWWQRLFMRRRVVEVDEPDQELKRLLAMALLQRVETAVQMICDNKEN